jgi:uncharacterized protein (TIGR03086 family)
MDALDAHTAAATDLEGKVAMLEMGKLDAATPCEGWTVRDLLHHVVAGNIMTTRLLLDGISRDEAIAVGEQDVLGDDPVRALKRTNAEADAAFRSADLTVTLDHPAMQMPGSQLINFRVGDLLLHAWDLSRAIGIDETLDPGAVAFVWEALQPMAPIIGKIGEFGTGPSGDVPEDAPLQTRLLDLTGRRP